MAVEMQAGGMAPCETVAFLDAFEPDEAAELLGQLDRRLIDLMCRTPAPANAEEPIVNGMAYWLLKDGLTRRAAGLPAVATGIRAASDF